jgi:hypothetical protein
VISKISRSPIVVLDDPLASRAVLLVVGIVCLVVGIGDYVAAAIITRNQAAPGGLGASGPPVIAQVLRRFAIVALLAGVALCLVGLAA